MAKIRGGMVAGNFGEGFLSERFSEGGMAVDAGRLRGPVVTRFTIEQATTQAALPAQLFANLRTPHTRQKLEKSQAIFVRNPAGRRKMNFCPAPYRTRRGWLVVFIFRFDIVCCLR